jgi:hypothetical protein
MWKLGDLDSATKADQQLKSWKGRKIRVTMKDGSAVEDALATTRSLRIYLSNGTDIPMEDAAQVELLD